MLRSRSRSCCVVLGAVGLPPRARAAAPWIYRGIVLPRHDIALDFGLGLGHAPDPVPNGRSPASG